MPARIDGDAGHSMDGGKVIFIEAVFLVGPKVLFSSISVSRLVFEKRVESSDLVNSLAIKRDEKIPLRLRIVLSGRSDSLDIDASQLPLRCITLLWCIELRH
jgi:hypothetical protein